jgi:simple sugar transport system permease protein
MTASDAIRRNRLVLAALIALLLATTSTLVGLPNTTSIALMALAAMVPIGLAAVGEIINQRGGLVNIGIEGIIVVSAFVAVFAAESFDSAIAGLVSAVAIGAAIAACFALITTYGGGSQVIAGLGLNLIALGIVSLALMITWRTPGFRLLFDDSLRTPRLFTPYGALSWFCVAVLAIAAAAAFLIENTRYGMRLKASGLNPFVTDAAGIDVYRLRLSACVIGGSLAGLAGGYLSLDYLGGVTKDVAQGRGFIALACLVFAALDIPLAIGIAFVFGFAEALGLWLQNVPMAKDFVTRGGSFFLLMIPYLAVIVALALFPGFERLSKMIGETYQRGR